MSSTWMVGPDDLSVQMMSLASHVDLKGLVTREDNPLNDTLAI
jgi:hypothetical protein